VIVPAIARANVPYHWSFYVPLALLHLSVALRVAGDLAGSAVLRADGGTFNAIAILAFIVSTIAAIARGKLAQA